MNKLKLLLIILIGIVLFNCGADTTDPLIKSFVESEVRIIPTYPEGLEFSYLVDIDRKWASVDIPLKRSILFNKIVAFYLKNLSVDWKSVNGNQDLMNIKWEVMNVNNILGKEKVKTEIKEIFFKNKKKKLICKIILNRFVNFFKSSQKLSLRLFHLTDKEILDTVTIKDIKDLIIERGWDDSF